MENSVNPCISLYASGLIFPFWKITQPFSPCFSPASEATRTLVAAASVPHATWSIPGAGRLRKLRPGTWDKMCYGHPGEWIDDGWWLWIYSESLIDTVDGCEILHHQKDGWNPINNGMFTTVFNWCRISSIHRIPLTSHCHPYETI